MTDALFVCVHNAGRSQMAAAIFNDIAQKLGLPLTAESAGTEPAERVHPNVAAAMAEWGIDIADKRPRILTNDLAAGARRVITMGCEVDEAACPALFLKDVEDWGLPDPANKSVVETRKIRAEIRRKALNLMLEMPEAKARAKTLASMLTDCE